MAKNQNDSHYSYLEHVAGENISEVLFENEPGVYNYNATIKNVSIEHSKPNSSMKFIKLKLLCELEEGGLIEPEFAWMMLDDEIKQGNKKSARTINHEIAWGKVSKMFRLLTGISISGLKGKQQVAFKVAILDGLFGKKRIISLPNCKEKYEIEVPDIVGLSGEFELEVKDSGQETDKGYMKTYRSWSFIKRIELKESVDENPGEDQIDEDETDFGFDDGPFK